MKICMLVPTIPPEFAGGGKLAYDQATHLAARGEACTIVTKTPNGRTRENLEIVHLPQLAIGPRQRLRIVDYLSLLPRFVRVIKRLDPDIVYVMSADAWTLLGTAAAKVLKLPVVLETSLAGSDDPSAIRDSRFGDVKFEILSEVDALVSVSPLLDDLAADAGLPAEQRHIIPNLVDTTLFSPPDDDAKRALRDRLGLGRFDQVIVFVGALIPRKGVMEIVRAHADIRSAVDGSLGLAVVGPVLDDAESERYFDELREFVKSRGTDVDVVFAGSVDNVQEWMAASDLFAFASTQEGFGTVIVEAMASGLPPVVRRIPRISEFIISSGVDGYVTDSSEEFCERLEELLTQPDHRREMGEAARRTALSRFGADVITDQYVELFRSVLGRV